MIDRFQMLVNIGYMDALTENPNLTREQIDLLYQTEDEQSVIKNTLATFPKLTDEQFTRFFNNADVNNTYLARNSNLTTKQIDLLYKTRGVKKNNLAECSKLTEEQFLRFFKEGKTNIDSLGQNPSINPETVADNYPTGVINWKW